MNETADTTPHLTPAEFQKQLLTAHCRKCEVEAIAPEVMFPSLFDGCTLLSEVTKQEIALLASKMCWEGPVRSIDFNVHNELATYTIEFQNTSQRFCNVGDKCALFTGYDNWQIVGSILFPERYNQYSTEPESHYGRYHGGISLVEVALLIGIALLLASIVGRWLGLC